MFYEMGWGTTDREALGRERILELARQNEIEVYAPCSTAWARVRSERPDLKLQHPGDKSSPGGSRSLSQHGLFLFRFCRSVA